MYYASDMETVLGYRDFSTVPEAVIYLAASHSRRQKKFYLFLFYLYIYPPDSQESDGGANTFGRQLPRPASGNAKILLSVWNLTKNMTVNKNCLPRPPSRESAAKCLFQGHNRMAPVGFET